MIMVSVIIAVYNHEKYIEQAIRSVLMQKTSFEFEVLIGEDCSPDGSREVLKGLEKECPPNFHFIYRESNYGADKNFSDLISRMNGKYFIILEGDDYWTYDHKLQEQVDYLENNPEYLACSHRVKLVDENSEFLHLEYPDCHDEEYTIEHFRKGLLPGHTSTNLYRNFYKDKIIDISLERVPFTAGDRKKAFMVVSQGKIHCIQEFWSCYRFITKGGSSFSANNKWSLEKLRKVQNFYLEMIKFAILIQNKEAQLAAEELYYPALLSEFRHTKNLVVIGRFICRFIKCRYKKQVIEVIRKKSLNS